MMIILEVLYVLSRCLLIPISTILFCILHYTENFEYSNLILKWSIEWLGGFFIKTVQFMASHRIFFHEKYASTLSLFYDQSPYSMSIKTVQSILHNIPICVDSIEETPIGSASIAQVHIGVQNNKTVVFKIQKPYAKLQFHIDLFFIQCFLMILTWWLGEIPSTPFLLEFIQQVENEFDFNREAISMRNAKDFFKTQQLHHAIVPEVYSYCKNVIVMEYIPNVKMSDAKIQNLNIDDKWSLCNELCDIFSKMIMVGKFIHIDPHIGNISIHRNLQDIILFDWGQSSVLSDNTIKGIAHLLTNRSMNINIVKIGMTICGIDIQHISIEDICNVIKFFDSSRKNTDFFELCKQLIQFTASKSRKNRNPFQKTSREIILMLKTHDLINSLMESMGINDPSIFSTKMKNISSIILENFE